MRKKSRAERIAELLIEGIVFAAETKDSSQAFKTTFRKCIWDVESGEIDVDCASWASFKRFIEAELPGYGEGYFESEKCKDRFGKSRFDAHYLTCSVDFLEKYKIAENNIQQGRGSKSITFKLKKIDFRPSNISLGEYARALIKTARDSQALNTNKPFTQKFQSFGQDFNQIQSSAEKGIPTHPPGSAEIDGRVKEIEALHSELQVSVTNQKSPTAICVCGMGGIGKTELCIHYIKNYREFYRDYICWIDMLASNPAEQIIEFAVINGYEEKLSVSPENNLRKLWRWSGWQNKRILFVYDDLWKVSEIENLLPPLEYTQFYILLTSRTKALPEQAKNRSIRNIKNHIISTISSEAGHTLFKRYAPEDKVSQEEEAIEDILAFVGYLPIGILSVATHTQRFSGGLHEVVDELFHTRKEWEQNPKGVMSLEYFQLSDDMAKTTKHSSVYISFLMTWKRLSIATRKACILICVSPREIILESIFNSLNETFEITRDSELKKAKISEAAADIAKLFILSRISEKTVKSVAKYSCHMLYRDFFRSQMSEEEISLWASTYQQIKASER